MKQLVCSAQGNGNLLIGKTILLMLHFSSTSAPHFLRENKGPRQFEAIYSSVCFSESFRPDTLWAK